MVSISQIIGGPGTGKTTRSMQIIESLGEHGIAPTEVGFASFTRIAVGTAAIRAATRFGVDPESLIGVGGWFRTLHSACYHMLGVKQNQLLTDEKESLRWISDVFGVEVGSTGLDAESGLPEIGPTSEISSILAWWGYCRNALVPIHEALKFAPITSSGIDDIANKIRHYERRKLIDGRVDFADLPLMVAGIKHEVTYVSKAKPIGTPPEVRAWILDEYQDTFPAIHAAARRITSHPDVQFIYCIGDPFQSIFGFSSGNPKFLMRGWEYCENEILDQSWRCPERVMQLGERLISNCSDYFNRRIKPRPGEIGKIHSLDIGYDGPVKKLEGGSWMFLARTNSQAIRIGKWLSKAAVPWRSMADANMGYLSTSQRAIAYSIIRLKNGESIGSEQWRELVSAMNSHIGEMPLLRPNAKIEFKNGLPSGTPAEISLRNLEANGGTEYLVNTLRSDQWHTVHRHADKIMAFDRAATAYGVSAAMRPTVTVGTIHAAKGDEADNVVLYDALSQRCRGNLVTSDQSANDEEWRVWYVGVTRARERLFTVRFPNDRYPMLRRV